MILMHRDPIWSLILLLTREEIPGSLGDVDVGTVAVGTAKGPWRYSLSP